MTNLIDKDNEKMGVYVTEDWKPVVDTRPNSFNEMMDNYTPPFNYAGCITYLLMFVIVIGFVALLYFGWLYVLNLPPFGYVSTPIAIYTNMP